MFASGFTTGSFLLFKNSCNMVAKNRKYLSKHENDLIVLVICNII